MVPVSIILFIILKSYFRSSHFFIPPKKHFYPKAQPTPILTPIFILTISPMILRVFNFRTIPLRAIQLNTIRLRTIRLRAIPLRTIQLYSAPIQLFLPRLKRAYLVLTCSSIILSSQAFAWGSKGHQMVAQIAKAYLNPGVNAKLEKYLGEDIVKASTWMDEIRSDHTMNRLKHCHYINIPKGADYQPNAKVNIVNELDRIQEDLRTIAALDPEKRTMDLKELIHLVGDIGQPLHCGYGEDHGGNEILVTYQGKETNLHKLWDSSLLHDHESEIDNLIKRLQVSLTETDKNTIWQSKILTWVNTSRSYLPLAYSFKDNTIDQAYTKKAEEVIAAQLFISGLRLAGILNEVFK